MYPSAEVAELFEATIAVRLCSEILVACRLLGEIACLLCELPNLHADYCPLLTFRRNLRQTPKFDGISVSCAVATATVAVPSLKGVLAVANLLSTSNSLHCAGELKTYKSVGRNSPSELKTVHAVLEYTPALRCEYFARCWNGDLYRYRFLRVLGKILIRRQRSKVRRAFTPDELIAAKRVLFFAPGLLNFDVSVHMG
ncbi:hypothetical protein GOBAR_DD05881 [Gossypium barbadense]|nr:hypothetical protein GOBAR_DD05881 [Gossypium barbadense]